MASWPGWRTANLGQSARGQSPDIFVGLAAKPEYAVGPNLSLSHECQQEAGLEAVLGPGHMQCPRPARQRQVCQAEPLAPPLSSERFQQSSLGIELHHAFGRPYGDAIWALYSNLIQTLRPQVCPCGTTIRRVSAMPP